MKELVENYNKLNPSLCAKWIDGTCTMMEHENEGSTSVLQQLEITNFVGWQFPHDLPDKIGSFYNISQNSCSKEKCHEIVRLSCDSILCVEETDKIIFYICELKSSYTKESITHAKDQIVGSLIKLRSVLSILQGFNTKNIEMRGIIFAYDMNSDRLSYFKNTSDPRAIFCLKLYNECEYYMPSKKCNDFWFPLSFPDIKLKYVKIPCLEKSYSLDFNILN